MRLFDITVDEVSLVDKAANKRKYAFMKRDDTSERKEIAKTEEVKEAAKILEESKKTEEVKTPEYTPEELASFNALLTEYTAVIAEFKGKK